MYNYCTILSLLKRSVLSVLVSTIMVTQLNAVTIGEIPDTSPEGKIAPPQHQSSDTYTYLQIAEIASKYPHNFEVIMNVLKCESGRVVKGEWVFSNGQSRHMLYNKAADETGREDSWGISQINVYWNPEVTKQQMLDPNFAVDFLSKRLDQGLGSRWTCYREIYH